MDVDDSAKERTSRRKSKRSGGAAASTVGNNHKAEGLSLDIADSIPQMYRILDLISEQGSGGLGEFPIHSLRQ